MPLVPNVGDRNAGLRVEGDHLVAGRDVDDPRLAAVGPVREPASRKLTGRRFAALPFVLAVHPDHLAGCRVECDHGAARAGRGVDDAVDHQRRALEVELGPGSERVGLEAPRDLELVEVVFVDLIERRVACVRQIAAIRGPLTDLRRLTAHPDRGGHGHEHDRNEETKPSRHR